MNITEEAKTNMNKMLNEFCCFNNAFPKSIMSTSDTIIKNLYDEMYKSYNYANRIMKSSCFKARLVKIDVISQLPKPNMYSTHFFPSEAKTFVDNNAEYWLKYSCKINKRKVNINFVLFKDKYSLTKYGEYVKKIYMWIHFLHTYALNTCSKELDIYLYMTPLQKKLPTNQLVVLSPEHANTAFTTGCQKRTEIIIYRKEEWFKVLLHESFHSFGLDFSSENQTKLNKAIKNMFPIQSEFNLYEAYCETWARIFNCLFMCFDPAYKKNTNEFVTCVNENLEIECNFSLFQTVKILRFMELKYENLFANDTYSKEARQQLYREKTNIFAYYVCTNILLCNYPYFLQWCKENNTSLLRFSKRPSNLDSFLELIQSKYKTTELIKNVKCMEKKLRTNVSNELYTSMRMSILELK